MIGDRKVLSFVAYRAQMFYETVSESTLGLTDVEEAASGAMDTVHQVDGCTGELLSDMEGLVCALNGGGGAADVAEADELGVGDRILAGEWVRRVVVQVAVGAGGLEIDVSFEAVTRDGDGKVQEGQGGIRDGPDGFEVGVKDVSKVDELLKLLVGARDEGVGGKGLVGLAGKEEAEGFWAICVRDTSVQELDVHSEDEVLGARNWKSWRRWRTWWCPK
eukprot:g46884.t1